MKKCISAIAMAITLSIVISYVCISVYANSPSNVVYRELPFTTAYGKRILVYDLVSDPFSEHFGYDSEYGYFSRTLAESTYNCFTYALVYDGNITGASIFNNTQKFQIASSGKNYGEEDEYCGVDGFLVAQNPCLTQLGSIEDAGVGDLVIYKWVDGELVYDIGVYAHAALITEIGESVETTKVKSKWGNYSIYYHYIDDCPYVLSANSASRMGEMPDYSLELEYLFFDVDHSYVYSTTSMTITHKRLYHYAHCTGCGAFHYERHQAGVSTCKCGYYVGVGTMKTIEENQLCEE